MKDKLILLMGVSGSGKTTLLTELLQTHSQLILVPSYTTRPMRSNEKNGRKYWHISKDDFQGFIDGGEFLEYALVHQKYYYGTKISEIKKAFDKGLIPITELDMNGLEEVRKDNKGIEYVSIFLDLPDDVMVERIKMRGGIYQEEINRRLFSTQKERKLAKKYCDYVLNTDNTLLQNIKNINKLVKKILNGK